VGDEHATGLGYSATAVMVAAVFLHGCPYDHTPPHATNNAAAAVADTLRSSRGILAPYEPPLDTFPETTPQIHILAGYTKQKNIPAMGPAGNGLPSVYLFSQF
jgi:hypothetical protein